jgi:uncharacterized protein YdhG (YjbR/CyaY superfamily)
MNTVDEYIATFDSQKQTKLNILRYIITDEVPNVTEKLSLGIPTYYFHGKLFSFAGQEGHFYFYPGASVFGVYNDDLEPYTMGKNTLCFAYDQPLPEDLLKMIIDYRVKENQSNPERSEE